MFARKCETRVGSITISCDACGDYYASFQVASTSPFKRAAKEGCRLSESSNYQKQRLKVAKLHRDVKRKRFAFEYKLFCELVKNHDRIAVEDLKVTNLLKNHSLAKSISDCAWGEFFRQLFYNQCQWDIYVGAALAIDIEYSL